MTDPEAALGALVQQALADRARRRVRGRRPADPAVRLRRLPVQRRHVAVQAPWPGAARHRRAEWRRRLDGAPVSWRRPRSAGPASSTSRSRDDWIAEQATAQLADPRLGVTPAESEPADRRGLLGPERRQGTARRSPAADRCRRRHRPRPRVPRPRRHPGRAPRRLGHPVRHADRARARRRRAGHLRPARGRRVHRVLPGGAGEVRRRPGVRRPGQASGSCSCRRASRDAMRLWQLLVDDSMEYLRRIYARLDITLDRRRHGAGELLQPDARRCLRRAGEPRARR